MFRIAILLTSIFIVAACGAENGDDPSNGGDDTIPGDTENGENEQDNGEDNKANGEDDQNNGDDDTANGEDDQDSDETDPNDSITLTFIDHDDDVVEEVEYEENEDLLFPDAPEREGFIFIEWDIPYDEIDFTEDVVVEPVFEIKVHTVTVEGPQGTMSTEELEHGESLELGSPEPIEGYRFIGYEEVPSEVTEDTVVHAVFEEIPEVTLNFHDESSMIMETVSGLLDEDLALPQAPEKNGYTFEGWALESEGETIDIYALDEGAHDLYAVYEAMEVTVHFEFGEGTDPVEVSIPYSQWVEVDDFIDMPERDHYEFSHWEDPESGYVFEDWIIADALDPFTVVAQWDGVTDEWLFDVEDGEATLTEYLKDDPDVIIPDTIAGIPVTTIGEALFYKDAFDDLELDSVAVGENVHTIEARAFDSQRDMASLTFENPEGIRHVETRAFRLVEADDLEFPTELLTIGALAFSNSSISSVAFNNDVEYIGERAFASTPITGTIEFPDSLTEIGESAFRETPVQSVMFNDGLEVIDDFAFYGTFELSDVSIPSSVDTIGSHAFRESENLETVTFENNSQVKKIGDYAFERTLKLHTVTLPENLEVIGRGAFKKNAALNTVDIPASVHTIGPEAFRQMDALTHITIPEGISELPHDLFWDSENLETVNLPDSLKTIGPQAFRNAKALKTIGIPEGVTEIGTSAFSRTEQLESIELPDGLKTINGSLFFSSNITEITIPEGITEIGDRAFQGSNIQEVDLPDSLKTIGIGAFKSTPDLQPLRLPDSLKTISAEAFENSGLDWVFIAESVTTNQNNAFRIYGDLTIYIERSGDHPDWHYNWNPTSNTKEYNTDPPE